MILDLMIKVGLGMLSSLVTKEVFARFTVETLGMWAKKTESTYDDKVVEIFAKAWEVPYQDLNDFLNK